MRGLPTVHCIAGWVKWEPELQASGLTRVNCEKIMDIASGEADGLKTEIQKYPLAKPIVVQSRMPALLYTKVKTSLHLITS